MTMPDDMTPRQRLHHIVEHLAHVLPAQAPIRDFVHHNTLHGFQHLPFAEALAEAGALTGAQTWWSDARCREAFAQGRIDRDDLAAALDDLALDDLDAPLPGGVSRRDLWLAALLVPQDVPDAQRLRWQAHEQSPGDAAFFALCRQLTGAQPASADWQAQAMDRWRALSGQVGDDLSLRGLLAHLTGEDVLETVRTILQRHLAAYLDIGLAAWRNPAQMQGFYAAWRASASLDFAWELDELPNIRDEIQHLPDNALDLLADELARLIPDVDRWAGYVQRLALEMPGWSGMFLWRANNPGRLAGPPVDMLDWLAVRVLLERLLCEDLMRRLTGAPMELDELRGYFAAELAEFHVRDSVRRGGLPEELQHRAARLLHPEERSVIDEQAWTALADAIAANADGGAEDALRLHALLGQLGIAAERAAALSPADVRCLLAEAARLDANQRGHLWLLAYERHYREQLFVALAARHPRQITVTRPSAQVVMCMDDREEGTRRHLEEIAPDIVTYGAAGFFGVPMYWQGMDDAVPTALCPVVVQPDVLVREMPAEGEAGRLARHAARRERRLRWREHLYQTTRRDPLFGPVLGALAAVPAMLALTLGSIAPGAFGESMQRWRRRFDGEVAGRLALTADAASAKTPAEPQHGFADAEQVDRVEAFLRMIGLTDAFAPLVLMFGHGSGSRNNPHLSAYDCGACSGRHGGPNARVFAAMANRPAVRAGLSGRGIVIPETTWFIAAEHNTCDDGIDWYDLAEVPAAFQPALDRLVGQLGEACRAHAAERCRRLASAPVRPTPWQARRHVAGRAHDISQARPELGHATNAAAFIGRRAMSRGLFLDRRVFLISYDPAADEGGRIVENILLAAGPVGAGISLEYYFSTVDNERFGCGSKITHNLTGLFGVMEGADSDLRTGLPWQMVEIHEPMRLLVVVEQEPSVLADILARQPALQELVGNAWIVLAAKHPSTGEIARYCPRRGWLPWSGPAVLPQAARSADWFAGESGPLPPAVILGDGR